MKTRYLLPLLFLSACSSSEPAPPPETRASTPSALEAAHEAYLRSDWLSLGDRLHDVLLDRSSGELVRENAFELLDKAYEATKGKLPSRFTLPSGIQHVKLGSMRGQHAWATYRTSYIYLRVDKGLGPHVTDIVVRALPGGAVLDRAAGIGELRVTPQDDSDEVVLEAKNVNEAIPDGVTSIHLALDDGRIIDTWVLTRGLASSASPEVATPAQSATFTEGTPTFEWTPFRSPEYAPFEDRTLSVYVSDEKTQKTAFDRWIWQPGDLAKTTIDEPLAPGSYWLALGAGEERSFGPIRLVRAAQRGVPFSIVR